MVSVLTIAGSDPSGGAGIEADLATFAALGVHGRTAITALTIQRYSVTLPPTPSPQGRGDAVFPSPLVREGQACPERSRRSEGEVHSTSPIILQKILSFQEHDILPDTIKIGMIGTLANLEVICDFLQRHPQIPVVLDPVLRATSGLELLEAYAIPMLKEKLWPLATVVTPNLDEAGILLGHRPTTVAEMESAARELQRGTQVVVVKGGHLDGDPVDVVWDGREMRHLTSERIAAKNLRGTGCRLASAIAAELALNKTPLDATALAKQFLRYRLSKSIYEI